VTMTHDIIIVTSNCYSHVARRQRDM